MSEMLRRTVGENLHLETVLAGGLWRTHADASQLEGAILNLAVNARDAMPDGGRLTIETANAHLDDNYAAMHADVTAGQYVMVAVSDTGVGMPPDVIAKAFDPFFTVDRRRTMTPPMSCGSETYRADRRRDPTPFNRQHAEPSQTTASDRRAGRPVWYRLSQ